MDNLSHVSVNVLGDAKLSCVWFDLEERVFVLSVKAIGEGVEQCSKLRAICICGHNLKKNTQRRQEDEKSQLSSFLCVYVESQMVKCCYNTILEISSKVIPRYRQTEKLILFIWTLK